jgi:hypothetical protein
LTLAPGVIPVKTPAAQTLTASAAGYCAGSPGVQFALGGTEKAAVYQLYKDGAEVPVYIDCNSFRRRVDR